MIAPAKIAKVLKLPMTLFAPEKSIVPCACAAAVSVMPSSIGPMLRMFETNAARVRSRTRCQRLELLCNENEPPLPIRILRLCRYRIEPMKTSNSGQDAENIFGDYWRKLSRIVRRP